MLCVYAVCVCVCVFVVVFGDLLSVKGEDIDIFFRNVQYSKVQYLTIYIVQYSMTNMYDAKVGLIGLDPEKDNLLYSTLYHVSQRIS